MYGLGVCIRCNLRHLIGSGENRSGIGLLRPPHPGSQLLRNETQRDHGAFHAVILGNHGGDAVVQRFRLVIHLSLGRADLQLYRDLI